MKQKPGEQEKSPHRICKAPPTLFSFGPPQNPSLSSDTDVWGSKQVITTQGQYDFLEGLTAEFTLPPSRPATPPPSTPHPRRRRKVSPSSTDAPPADPPVKRKRRSPVKQERVTAEEETVQKDSITETQVRGEHKRGGWFDIVMGSHEAESESEDDSQRKRKYRYACPS